MALCWPPANVYLLACYNFGIQEYSAFGETTREVFDGCPEMKDGYLYANEKPGWGIEINEKATAKYPFGVQWWPRRRKKIDSVYDFIPRS